MERKIVTVTALTRYLKYKIDRDEQLQDILLRAEISNFKHHSRGHFYFTLKDESAQISAVMFMRDAEKILFQPKDGMKVLVEGSVSVYEPYGNYQLYVRKMTEDGVGELYLQYEKRKRDLEEAGWFDPARKRPIPMFPKAIGVVTSPTGAAVRDIIRVISRRYPLTKIIVYPALVQGEQAKDSIASQIHAANQDGLVDTLIVGRGGGSIEDLWAFNELVVAEAIRNSTIPVISAVGHEIDFTIADFVADVRAATPSQAAEIAVVDRVTLFERTQSASSKLRLQIQHLLDRRTKQLMTLTSSRVLRDPRSMFTNAHMKTDQWTERLLTQHPKKRIDLDHEKCSSLEARLSRSMQQQLDRSKRLTLHVFDKLELVNPLGIMKRGFALATKEEHIVTHVSEVQVGDTLSVRVQDGQIETQVLAIHKEDSSWKTN